MKQIVGIVLAAAMLTGCGTTAMPSMLGGPTTTSAWTPMIDTRGVNQTRYERDLVECRAFADANPDANASQAARDGAKRNGLTAGALMVGATVATGGLAMIPLAAGSLLFGTGASAALGADSARSQAALAYRSIVSNCLEGRGYSVIH